MRLGPLFVLYSEIALAGKKKGIRWQKKLDRRDKKKINRIQNEDFAVSYDRLSNGYAANGEAQPPRFGGFNEFESLAVNQQKPLSPFDPTGGLARSLSRGGPKRGGPKNVFGPKTPCVGDSVPKFRPKKKATKLNLCLTKKGMEFDSIRCVNWFRMGVRGNNPEVQKCEQTCRDILDNVNKSDMAACVVQATPPKNSGEAQRPQGVRPPHHPPTNSHFNLFPCNIKTGKLDNSKPHLPQPLIDRLQCFLDHGYGWEVIKCGGFLEKMKSHSKSLHVPYPMKTCAEKCARFDGFLPNGLKSDCPAPTTPVPTVAAFDNGLLFDDDFDNVENGDGFSTGVSSERGTAEMGQINSSMDNSLFGGDLDESSEGAGMGLFDDEVNESGEQTGGMGLFDDQVSESGEETGGMGLFDDNIEKPVYTPKPAYSHNPAYGGGKPGYGGGNKTPMKPSVKIESSQQPQKKPGRGNRRKGRKNRGQRKG